MSRIFISYRREDSADVAGRIYDRLIQKFGQGAIFMDVDAIPYGEDFRTHLDEQVAKCDVFLAVIGRDWMKKRGSKGKSRLDDQEDFVRIEVESALKRGIRVIPVLVGKASLPPAERLPASMQALPYRHAIAVRPNPDFHRDMDRLIEDLKQHVLGFSESQSELDSQSKPIPKEKQQVVLAAPVDMVKIPKGSFYYGEQKIRKPIDYDYWIDQYPVTNKQYSAFISAGGYGNELYWSPEGWKWRIEDNVTTSKYWNDLTWNQADHPVVGVSYYEAEAYAKWAGKRLPTEKEWEKAARGEDGWQYPWGDEFDEKKCNSRMSAVGHTTSVTLYRNGVSPYECYDMAGNVWEWCADWYDGEEGRERVLRGGCLSSTPEILRVWYRYKDFPHNQCEVFGFRLVQDIEK